MATIEIGRVRPVYKGNYSSSSSYTVLDRVLFEGSVWECVADAPAGTSPQKGSSTFWVEIGARGEQGPKGDTGDKGDTGPKGATGPEGPKGADGVTPNVSATVTTLPAGYEATVSQTGSVEAPMIEFGIPRGDTGPALNILGTYESEDALKQAHPTGKLGDGYVAGGDLCTWNGVEWINVGPIQGPKGDTGPTGPAGTTKWSELQGKPQTYPPSSHKHVYTDISNMPEFARLSGAAFVGNVTVGGKNTVRAINGITADSAGNLDLPNFEQDGAKTVGSPNYDLITEPGFYGCPSTGQTNGPGGPRKLLVMGLPGAKAFVTQVAFPIGKGICPAIRYLDDNGAWTPWERICLVDSTEEVQATRLTSKGGQFRSVIKGFTKGGELPETSVYSHWSIFDEKGFDYTKNRMGAFQYRASKDGSSFMCMWVNANNANDETAAALGIGVMKNGKVYTSAPAPADTSDAVNEIATVHWVRANGGSMWGLGTVAPSVSSRFDENDCDSIDKTGFYTVSSTANSVATSVVMHIERAYTAGVRAVQLTFIDGGRVSVRTRTSAGWSAWTELAQDPNVVHKTGNETIAGAKTFTDTVYANTELVRRISADAGRIVQQHTDLVKGTNPSVGKWFDFSAVDSKGLNQVNRAGAFSIGVYPTGETRAYIRAYQWKSGSSTSAELYVGMLPDGTTRTYAPAPEAASNDNSIATTKWVRTLMASNALAASDAPEVLIEPTPLAVAKKARTTAVAQITVDVDGMVFDGNEAAQTRMTRTLTAAMALGRDLEKTTTRWVLADDSVGYPTLKQLAEALDRACNAQTELWVRPYEEENSENDTPTVLPEPPVEEITNESE